MGPSPFTVTLHIRVLYTFLILSKYNAAVNKPHWEPKNFCTNDNCSVRDSKNVCWWACGNRWTFIFMYSLSYLDFTYFLPLGLVHSWLTLLDIWFEAPHPLFAARAVMMERNESGPIRPCHIREAYRRLKLEGKVPRRSVPRLFR